MPRSLPTQEANVIVTGCLGSATGPAPFLDAESDLSSELPQPAASTATRIRATTASGARDQRFFSTSISSMQLLRRRVNDCVRPAASFSITPGLSRAQPDDRVERDVLEREPM